LKIGYSEIKCWDFIHFLVSIKILEILEILEINWKSIGIFVTGGAG